MTLVAAAHWISFQPDVGGKAVVIDTSAAGQRQILDGFGTCLSSTEGQQTWWQEARLAQFK
ncbi:MAG: hypothetical protein AAB466_06660 [Verrucomicrobiota bacterium]